MSLSNNVNNNISNNVNNNVNNIALFHAASFLNPVPTKSDELLTATTTQGIKVKWGENEEGTAGKV